MDGAQLSVHHHSMRSLAAFLLAACFSGIVSAATLCAATEGPLYANAPVPGEKLPPEVSRLHKGASYKVVREGAGWVLLDMHTSRLWAERKFFGTSTTCVDGPTSGATAGAVAGAGAAGAASLPKAASPLKAAPKADKGADVVGCPCGSGQVCIGPRGGRYCITSGGNKRYGV